MTEKTQISGSVERITFYNAENGYSVVRLKPDTRGMLPFKYASGRDSLITIVGNLPEVNPGEWLKLTGQWTSHPRHGRQFQVELCEQSLPATTEGIRRYLGSGMIRGVGRVMAERIVDEFGTETMDVIDHDPEKLLTVPGIGEMRVHNIVQSWAEQRAIKDVMLFLQSHGVSTGLALKIYKKYGDDALAIVQTRPYQLVRDVHGIGFKTADKIARALGLAPDDPGRIEAGIAYTLNRMAEEGHVYVPQEQLEPEAAEILGVAEEQVTAVLDQLEAHSVVRRETITYEIGARPQANVISSPTGDAEEDLLREEQAVYLAPLYQSEVGVTRQVQQLVGHPTSRLGEMGKRVAASSLQGLTGGRQADVTLTQQQEAAVRTAVSRKVTILTGGPGTGKTTTLRTLLDLLDRQGGSYALASPTGRAAKRLSEATGRPAKTIHRLLEFKPGEGFGRHAYHPIDADLVVIDEASMLDVVLANHLFKAIGADSHVLLVGDVDQLPSVGAGDVLRDLIASGVAAVIRLEAIFRQAAGSLIIHNAHRINQGRLPETRPDADDFFIFIKPDVDEAAELLVDIVQRRLPHRFGLDPLDDVQVLAPMYNGAAGVTALNERLQAALNPPGRRKLERRQSGRVFRAGDKVMQTVNNYDKNVYNGDIGRITGIDAMQQTMTISLDGAPVVYDFLELDELVHAFCISVHKSQGAEYPCVVLPVVMSHYMMLQRNLLYTAVTRAKKLVILVGTRKAIAIAVKNDRTTRRHTALDWRLRH